MRNKKANKMVAHFTEYNGKPIIMLFKDDDKYSFKFGLSKAKLILDNIDEIKRFVKENDK